MKGARGRDDCSWGKGGMGKDVGKERKQTTSAVLQRELRCFHMILTMMERPQKTS